jgi:transposase
VLTVAFYYQLNYKLINLKKMEAEIKRLKKELKEWKSQEVKERFEIVNSQIHIVTINELEIKIKRFKRGEDI